MITPLPPSPGEFSLIEIIAMGLVIITTINATLWYHYRSTLYFASTIFMLLELFVVVCG